MAAKSKITYRAYTDQAQFEAVRNALLQAEQTHYLLTLQNEELDGSLPERTAAAEAEVNRLQGLFDDADKARPKA